MILSAPHAPALTNSDYATDLERRHANARRCTTHIVNALLFFAAVDFVLGFAALFLNAAGVSGDKRGQKFVTALEIRTAASAGSTTLNYFPGFWFGIMNIVIAGVTFLFVTCTRRLVRRDGFAVQSSDVIRRTGCGLILASALLVLVGGIAMGLTNAWNYQTDTRSCLYDGFSRKCVCSFYEYANVPSCEYVSGTLAKIYWALFSVCLALFIISFCLVFLFCGALCCCITEPPKDDFALYSRQVVANPGAARQPAPDYHVAVQHSRGRSSQHVRGVSDDARNGSIVVEQPSTDPPPSYNQALLAARVPVRPSRLSTLVFPQSAVPSSFTSPQSAAPSALASPQLAVPWLPDSWPSSSSSESSELPVPFFVRRFPGMSSAASPQSAVIQEPSAVSPQSAVPSAANSPQPAVDSALNSPHSAVPSAVNSPLSSVPSAAYSPQPAVPSAVNSPLSAAPSAVSSPHSAVPSAANSPQPAVPSAANSRRPAAPSAENSRQLSAST